MAMLLRTEKIGSCFMIWIINAITFLSAFLLFQIELIIAKLFLPNYGGSYLVWGACVVFFQAALLFGYFFAQFCLDRWGMERYRKIHVALVLLPFLFFPGRDLVVHYSQNQLPLVADVFVRLLTTVGPVFFVLSTMSVTWQVWLSRSNLRQRQNPYALYAVSNLGSFAALFSYPFLFEYLMKLSTQVAIWRTAYLVFAALNLAAFFLIRVTDEPKQKAVARTPIAAKDIIRWMMLGAAGVVMFLSVTNIITYEVTPVPLFWIIPLGIYLLAFVLNFKKNPWCPSWISRNILLILGLNVSLFFITQQWLFSPFISVILLCFSLFVLCMYCQHELILQKPRSSADLPFFYVMISLGSFLGGFLTSWIIPLVSTNTVEYLIGLLLIASVRIFDQYDKRTFSWLNLLALCAWIGLLFLWPVKFAKYSTVGLVILAVGIWLVCFQLTKTRWAFIIALIAIAAVSSNLTDIYRHRGGLFKERNYYGIYEIFDRGQLRTFLHGTTLHGVQLQEGPLKPIPIGYYSPQSPVGEVMIEGQETLKKVALIGLGAGSLAAYGNPKQSYDFYELDPDVYKMAKEYFTYLDVSASHNEFFFGDARLSLQKNVDRQYDAIIVDAFGGDAIPTHLVTKDVVELYRQHLASNGLILFHTTNRYLSLEPILARVAQSLGAFVCYKDAPQGELNLRSIWVAITWDPQIFRHLVSAKAWQTMDERLVGKYPLWTDQYSSILPIFKVDQLVGALKSFKLLVW
jgi:hypothetical protein